MKTTAPKYTVLLVDDERNFLRVLEARLRREGYSTLSAFDGAEALTVLRRYPVSVVVLDVQMSGLSGQETLTAMHALRPDLPVVLMSAYGKPEGLPYPVTYLEKPFNLDMLVSAVANAVRVRRPVPAEASAFALFSPGQRVRLVVPDNEELCYSSGLIQGETEDTLTMDAPSRGGQPVTPPANAAVRVTVTGRDALYSFNTRVQRSDARVMVLTKPDIIERNQRRRAPRHTARLQVRLDVIPPGEKSGPVRLSAAWNSVNLSESGMMVTGGASVPANSAVVFTVSLPEPGGDIQGRARVVWDLTGPGSRSTMGLEFIGLEETERSILQAFLRTVPPAAPATAS